MIAASSGVICFTVSSGEVRSGSEKKMSKAITAAPLVGELGDQVGDGGTRPRPLANLGQRLLVDIDKSHRQVGIVLGRPEQLIGIEGDQPERLHQEGVGGTDEHGSAENDGDDHDVGDAGLVEPLEHAGFRSSAEPCRS